MKKNIALKKHTTLGIGGPAAYFRQAKTQKALKAGISAAKDKKLPFLVIGSGSNLLVSDKGFSGVIIKNSIERIKVSKNSLTASAGALLQDLVDAILEAGISGMECLTDIPGTVGGAVYGNAGAYGQTISDKIIRVLTYDVISGKEAWLLRQECNFSYRDSRFKKNKNLIILECEFFLPKGNKKELKTKAKDILAMRRQKYPQGIRCPGSFFKNVVAGDLSKKVLFQIPEDKIVYGKIPAGWLLETVGARGKRIDGVQIASYHGNLFINSGGGTAKSFLALARKYQREVKRKFGIELEAEVQLVGFKRGL